MGGVPTTLTQDLVSTGTMDKIDNAVTRIVTTNFVPSSPLSYYVVNVKDALAKIAEKPQSKFGQAAKTAWALVSQGPKTIQDVNSVVEFNLRLRLAGTYIAQSMAKYDPDVLIKSIAELSPEAQKIARSWWKAAGMEPSTLLKFSSGKTSHIWSFVMPDVAERALRNLPESERTLFSNVFIRKLDEFTAVVESTGREVTAEDFKLFFSNFRASMDDELEKAKAIMAKMAVGDPDMSARPTARQQGENIIQQQTDILMEAERRNYTPSDKWKQNVSEIVAGSKQIPTDFTDVTFRKELEGAGIHYDEIQKEVKTSLQESMGKSPSKAQVNRESAKEAYTRLTQVMEDRVVNLEPPTPDIPHDLPGHPATSAALPSDWGISEAAPESVQRMATGRTSAGAYLQDQMRQAGLSPNVVKAQNQFDAVKELDHRLETFFRTVSPGPEHIVKDARHTSWSAYWKLREMTHTGISNFYNSLAHLISSGADEIADVSIDTFLRNVGIDPHYADGKMVGYTLENMEGIRVTHWDMDNITSILPGAKPGMDVAYLRDIMKADSEQAFKQPFLFDRNPLANNALDYVPTAFEDVPVIADVLNLTLSNRTDNAIRMLAQNYHISTQFGKTGTDINLIRDLNTYGLTDYNNLAEFVSASGGGEKAVRRAHELLEMKEMAKHPVNIVKQAKAWRTQLVDQFNTVYKDIPKEMRDFYVSMWDSAAKYWGKSTGKAPELYWLKALREFSPADEISIRPVLTHLNGNPMWYSPLEEMVKDSSTFGKKMPGNQWLNYLSNRKVKKDELKFWGDLGEWLADPAQNSRLIDQSEMVKYLADHPIPITETIYKSKTVADLPIVKPVKGFIGKDKKLSVWDRGGFVFSLSSDGLTDPQAGELFTYDLPSLGGGRTLFVVDGTNLGLEIPSGRLNTSFPNEFESVEDIQLRFANFKAKETPKYGSRDYTSPNAI